MRIIRAKDYNDMSRKAANIIAAQITLKPDSVIGLATGSTPIGAYKELINKHKEGNLDFSEVRGVNLDEYKGLTKDNDQSYDYFMKDNLYNHVNIKAENCYIPNGMAEDDDEECRRYDELLETLPRDLQLLGLGLNGHIGFNEPSDVFAGGTNLVQLTDSTIEANSRFFESYEATPKFAYTMGIKGIMSARTILLCVSGKSKAQILHDLVNGPITPQVPASILQLHKDVILVADEDALSLM
ncbi:MAG: glucosamine-6-phosphate deaminase [Clostridiales bacterium]|nr:glucosamine-6-phosphate deaminase [Clostridiales bacterium]